MLYGFQKTSLVDFPGKIVSTVFFRGCNFRCPFCHNKELVIFENSSKPTIFKEDILKHLIENKMYLDGVCITGGEPTLSADLYEFILMVKKNGFLIKLDTNGTNPELLDKLISEDLLDYVAMDIKAPFSKYNLAIGMNVDIMNIKKSISILKDSNVMHEFRSTILPSIHTFNDVIELVKQVSPCKKFFIQNFRNTNTLLESYRSEKSFSNAELNEMKKEILKKEYAQECDIRGLN